MKNIKYAVLVVITVCLIIFLGGCNGTQIITVEYLPGFEAQNWFTNDSSESQPQSQPTIAVNPFWDERSSTDSIGGGNNGYGMKLESWATDQPPTEILENAIIKQLENAGFKVIRTSGWNLSAESIPDYINADFILGGRLKAFWVESRPGFWTVSVNSTVSYDLIIADTKSKKIIWAGQFTGTDTKETPIRTKEDMRSSISRSLTQAVNKAFQDEQARAAVLTIFRIKF